MLRTALQVHCKSSPGKFAPSRKANATGTSKPKPAPKSTQTPSLNRLDCIHFDKCSGCSQSSSITRPPISRTAEGFFADNGYFGFELAADSVHAWRCRARLAVRGKPGKPVIGLFQEDTHVVTPIPECRIHHPRINQAAELLVQLIKQLKIAPYDEASNTGDLKYIQLTMAPSPARTSVEDEPSAEVQVVLIWNAASASDPGFTQRCIPLAQLCWSYGRSTKPTPLIHSVWANFQCDGNSNVILGRSFTRLHGEEDLWLKFGGAKVCVGPGSFIQANYGMMNKALAAIHAHVPRGSNVVEFHAGVGVIGLSLAGKGLAKKLTCVEINPACEEPFKQSRSQLAQDLDISYMLASAGQVAADILHDVDVVIVDPPRKGLEPALIAALCKSVPPTPSPQSASISPSTASPDAPQLDSPSHLAQPSPSNSSTSSSPLPTDATTPSQSISSASSPASSSPSPLTTPDPNTIPPVDSMAVTDVSSIPATPTTAPSPSLTTLGANHSGGGPSTLVYMSCGFDAFQRDCTALLASGRWKLHYARGFLFFPGTDSIETLAVFKAA